MINEPVIPTDEEIKIMNDNPKPEPAEWMALSDEEVKWVCGINGRPFNRDKEIRAEVGTGFYKYRLTPDQAGFIRTTRRKNATSSFQTEEIQDGKIEAPLTITGYRKLSEKEITLMNDVKRIGNILGGLLDGFAESNEIDKRWLSIGRTHLQQGIMAVCRAIAKPEGF